MKKLYINLTTHGITNKKMENTEQLRNGANKLLNRILIGKYPLIIDRVKVKSVKVLPNDIIFNIKINITQSALEEGYKAYIDTFEGEILYNIDEYASHSDEIEMDIQDMLGVNIYDELRSILSYLVTEKNPIPSYMILSPGYR